MWQSSYFLTTAPTFFKKVISGAICYKIAQKTWRENKVSKKCACVIVPISQFMVFAIKRSFNTIQLTLEQHELNSMGALTCGFFSTVNSNTRSKIGWMRIRMRTNLVFNLGSPPSCMWRANYEIYSDFRLQKGLAPPTPALFKGQLYF